MGDDRPEDLDGIPSMADEPVVWDPSRRAFVPVAAKGAPAESRGRPRQHVIIPAPEAPPAPGGRPARTAPPAPPVPPAARRARPARAPAPPPAAAPAKKRRRRWPRVLLALVLAVALLGLGLFGYGWWQFSKIPTVDVAKVLSPGGGAGTNYLIVGSDSRAGISASDPGAGAFLNGPAGGARTDTIMVLRIEGSKRTLLSIPRDLFVKNPTTGELGRINATYETSPATLIQAVKNLGIPIQHYLEINFVSFAKLVDSMGGITIDFPNPARDTNSGLDVAKAGKVRLQGDQALAYVRSRHYEELINGKWQTDPTADLGRVQRQRAFMKALLDKATGSYNPFTLVSIGGSMGGGLKIDNTLSYFDAIGLAWDLRSFNPESLTLPVTPRTTSGGAAVLDLKTAEAQPIVDQFSR